MKRMLTAALAAAITMGMCPAAEIPVMAANTGTEAVVDSGPPPLQSATRNTISLEGVTIVGKPQVGQTLTAKVSPDGATASYKWRRIADNGIISDMGGPDSYTLTADDWNCTIEVIATGTGNYSGEATARTGKITVPLTGITIEGTPQVGETLTAKVSPEGATASYQWWRSSADGTVSPVLSTSGSYALTADDWNCKIEVEATGTNGYSGTQNATMDKITVPLTGVIIEGTPQVGETLTAKVSPDGATASYEWRRLSVDGIVSPVLSTSDSYTPTAVDLNYFIQVIAIGTGSYAGSTDATTDEITAAAIGGVAIEGTPQVGKTLTAKVSPDGGTANYQWRRIDANGDPSAVLSTSDSYALTAADWNCKIEVEATGTDGYTGTQTATTDKIQPAPLTGVTIEGTPQAGETLTAKVSPDGGTANYQWRRLDASGNPSAVVSTSDSYALTAADLNCKIEVEATGTGGYTGTKTASTTEIQPVPPSPGGSTGGGTTGSSSGGSSSGGDSSRRNSSMIGAKNNHGSVSTGGGNDPAASAREVAAQLEAAKAAGRTPRADVVVKNAKSVSPETLRAMNEAAAKQGGTARFLADTTQDGQIVARMYLDAAAAANLTGDIQTGVSVDGKEAVAVANHFAQHFTNPVKVVSFSQKGPFGMKVDLALKVDLSGLDVENLVFYSYDIATNSYQEIETACFVDMNGYLHLTVDSGGSLVIADGALTPR